jgi:hypothetical protein
VARHRGSEVIDGDVRKIIVSLPVALGQIRKLRIRDVDGLVIRLWRGTPANIYRERIRVELVQINRAQVEVRVESWSPTFFDWFKIHDSNVQLILKTARESQVRPKVPKPPFGPSPIT